MKSRDSSYRRIIDAYRGKLMQVDAVACKSVDIQVEDWGFGWVTDDAIPDLDRLMTAGEIASSYGFSVQNIRDWARRHPDEIKKYKKGSTTLFLLREVLAYQARRQ
jgi:hypothetical protein